MDIISIIIGLVSGFVLAWLFYRQKDAVIAGIESTVQALQNQIAGLNSVLSETRVENSNLVSEVSALRQVSEQASADKNTIDELREANLHDKSLVAKLNTQLDLERKQASEKIVLLKGAEESLKDQFKNLASEIFEEKDKKFNEVSKKNIESLINPFKEQIKEFHKKLEENDKSETQYRGRLSKTLEGFMEAQAKLSSDAKSLTGALKGDKKLQGCWGELILERVFEDSGLTKGREYTTQGAYKNSEGKLLKPDAIVNLPDQRQVVVDSKVSLVAYEKFYALENEAGALDALEDHKAAVKQHIKLLSEKSYEDLYGVNSLDFTVLFMPIEGALQSVIQSDPSILEYASKKKIILVGPSTLILCLKTIESLWQIQHQNKNAEVIAKKAAEMYDKFANFVQDLEKVGKHLGQTHKAYEEAQKKLTGRGSLIKKCESLKELGVKPSKAISAAMIEEAGLTVESGEVA